MKHKEQMEALKIQSKSKTDNINDIIMEEIEERNRTNRIENEK